eukprot:TRINITY_DN15134_c0_g1_i1.p1 TRINITY_DN15134_c0_g1~~TRINITY_DN15134_c0_g1_i1.p1  ORF type:complete len:432 (-),score=87.71 TRINITY_DN15134_c0_g1_i1:327-1622(-)
MDNLALAPSKFLLGYSPNLCGISNSRRSLALPLYAERRSVARKSRSFASAIRRGSSDALPPKNLENGLEKLETKAFASISSSSGRETSSVGVNPQFSAPPPPSSIGSPLFWIGVGVGLSALFSWVATNLKKYAMQQAFKTLMGQMTPENSQFSNAAFSPGSPFPFPMSSTAAPAASSPSPVASQPVVTIDVPATKVEAKPAVEVRDDTEVKTEPKRYAFVDVPPEVLQKDRFENLKESTETNPSKDVHYAEKASTNGAVVMQDESASSDRSQSTRKPVSGLSVEALEKMMEDPTVQKMVYPYLPEEMRNPTTFKWMLQNPQYRQQLEDMLNNMGGTSEWDNRMMDTLKDFDLSSPEVKQQFDQIGLTPEEVISKIMANPEVAMAFQNPKVQAAIMDCSQNPLSIAKYQHDKEIMDVFNKISELFPGVTGPP